jgi:hypothetical protein
MLVRVHRLRVEYVSTRRTVHGWHVVVCVRQRLSMLRVVCFQAILASDWRREIFNSRRAIAWRNVPDYWRGRANVLYERHYRERSEPCPSDKHQTVRFRMGKCARS